MTTPVPQTFPGDTSGKLRYGLAKNASITIPVPFTRENYAGPIIFSSEPIPGITLAFDPASDSSNALDHALITVSATNLAATGPLDIRLGGTPIPTGDYHLNLYIQAGTQSNDFSVLTTAVPGSSNNNTSSYAINGQVVAAQNAVLVPPFDYEYRIYNQNNAQMLSQDVMDVNSTTNTSNFVNLPAGQYTLNCAVTDGSGLRKTSSTSITVGNTTVPQLAADIQIYSSDAAPYSYTFKGFALHGQQIGGNFNYHFDFGDGTVQDIYNTPLTEVFSNSHAFPNGQQYFVTLTVSNADDSAQIQTQVGSNGGNQPNMNISAGIATIVGGTNPSNNANAANATAVINNPQYFTGPFTYTFDFGDGQPLSQTTSSTTALQNYFFQEYGTHTVNVRVEDATGQFAVATASYTTTAPVGNTTPNTVDYTITLPDYTYTGTGKTPILLSYSFEVRPGGGGAYVDKSLANSGQNFPIQMTFDNTQNFLIVSFNLTYRLTQEQTVQHYNDTSKYIPIPGGKSVTALNFDMTLVTYEQTADSPNFHVIVTYSDGTTATI